MTEVFERKVDRNVPCMVLLKMHVTTGQNFNARPYGKMFFKFSLLKLLSHLKVYLVDMSGLLSYTMFYHVFIDQELKMFTIKEKKLFQWENVKIYNLQKLHRLNPNCIYSKTSLYCPSIHRQTPVSPRISAVPFSVCSNNPDKMPNSHTAIRHGN